MIKILLKILCFPFLLLGFLLCGVMILAVGIMKVFEKALDIYN